MTASFLRAFAPTETDPERLGLQQLATGRQVFRTRKVEIGVRAGERPDSVRVMSRDRVPDPGISATKVQGWILGGAWSSSPDATEKINTATFVRKCLRAMLRIRA